MVSLNAIAVNLFPRINFSHMHVDYHKRVQWTAAKTQCIERCQFSKKIRQQNLYTLILFHCNNILTTVKLSLLKWPLKGVMHHIKQSAALLCVYLGWCWGFHWAEAGAEGSGGPVGWNALVSACCIVGPSPKLGAEEGQMDLRKNLDEAHLSSHWLGCTTARGSGQSRRQG